MFIYALTSIVVKTAELLMLKRNLNIGPSALIIAERELLNKQRRIPQWEQSQDAFVISVSERRRVILLLRHFNTQTASLLFAQTEFGRRGITQTRRRIAALKINAPHVSLGIAAQIEYRNAEEETMKQSPGLSAHHCFDYVRFCCDIIGVVCVHGAGHLMLSY